MITDDDREFLQSFEQCSLGKQCWTHTNHIRMAWLQFEMAQSFDEALERIRTGIMRFNTSVQSVGYHETITVAFARTIDARRLERESFEEFALRNKDLFEKNFLDTFYSPGILSTKEAKSTFVEPDLKKLPDRTKLRDGLKSI